MEVRSGDGVEDEESRRHRVGGQFGFTASAGALPHLAEVTLDGADRDSEVPADLPA
jgi:hypothetical protein